MYLDLLELLEITEQHRVDVLYSQHGLPQHQTKILLRCSAYLHQHHHHYHHHHLITTITIIITINEGTAVTLHEKMFYTLRQFTQSQKYAD